MESRQNLFENPRIKEREYFCLDVSLFCKSDPSRALEPGHSCFKMNDSLSLVVVSVDLGEVGLELLGLHRQEVVRVQLLSNRASKKLFTYTPFKKSL